MLVRFTELLNEVDGHLAMLVKTSVARKISLRMFKSGASMTKASIHRIDTAKEFDVSVDACLLVIRFSEHSVNSVDGCEIFDTLEQEMPVATLGWRDGKLVSNPSTYDRLASRYLASAKPELLWRSGIKHDCSKVFELKMQGGDLINGHGDVVDIEYEYLFPLLKCTDLAHDRKVTRWVICPQKRVGADTKALEGDAPYLWKYLVEYSDRIDNRRSKIYLNKPRFSIFGIGPYSFQPWKIAISGLHKSYDFRLIGPHASKPVLFDDTCYQLGFNTRQEAEKIYTQVTDDMCVEFLNSLTFWDNKRPVTADILNQLHIASVSTQ